MVHDWAKKWIFRTNQNQNGPAQQKLLITQFYSIYSKYKIWSFSQFFKGYGYDTIFNICIKTLFQQYMLVNMSKRYIYSIYSLYYFACLLEQFAKIFRYTDACRHSDSFYILSIAFLPLTCVLNTAWVLKLLTLLI